MSKLLSKEELAVLCDAWECSEVKGLIMDHILEQEKEIERLRESFQGMLKGADKWLKRLETGCGNHGCQINPPQGQGTNMICQCLKPSTIRREMRWIRSVASAALNQKEG